MQRPAGRRTAGPGRGGGQRRALKACQRPADPTQPSLAACSTSSTAEPQSPHPQVRSRRRRRAAAGLPRRRGRQQQRLGAGCVSEAGAGAGQLSPAIMRAEAQRHAWRSGTSCKARHPQQRKQCTQLTAGAGPTVGRRIHAADCRLHQAAGVAPHLGARRPRVHRAALRERGWCWAGQVRSGAVTALLQSGCLQPALAALPHHALVQGPRPAQPGGIACSVHRAAQTAPLACTPRRPRRRCSSYAVRQLASLVFWRRVGDQCCMWAVGAAGQAGGGSGDL